MDKKLTEELKGKLEKEKSRIEKELMGFATEDKNVKDNWDAKYPDNDRGNKEEEADDAGEYENLLSLEQSLELKLKDVNAALEKIQKGNYGICEKCSNKIEEERLKAYPEARLCIKDNENK